MVLISIIFPQDSPEEIRGEKKKVEALHSHELEQFSLTLSSCLSQEITSHCLKMITIKTRGYCPERYHDRPMFSHHFFFLSDNSLCKNKTKQNRDKHLPEVHEFQALCCCWILMCHAELTNAIPTTQEQTLGNLGKNRSRM